jgi:hypothetical protein
VDSIPPGAGLPVSGKDALWRALDAHRIRHAVHRRCGAIVLKNARSTHADVEVVFPSKSAVHQNKQLDGVIADEFLC